MVALFEFLIKVLLDFFVYKSGFICLIKSMSWFCYAVLASVNIYMICGSLEYTVPLCFHTHSNIVPTVWLTLYRLQLQTSQKLMKYNIQQLFTLSGCNLTFDVSSQGEKKLVWTNFLNAIICFV